MTFPLHLRFGERMGMLGLLLLLLAVLTGVSLTQAGLLEHQADTLEDNALPGLRRVHDLRRLADEARGLEAMHLLARDDDERRQVEQQIQYQRQVVQGRLLMTARRSVDVDDERLQALVGERLTAYWTAQDKVLAASRRQAADAPALGHAPGAASGRPSGAGEGGAWPATDAVQSARQLMAGESQAAWAALTQALAQWLAHQERRAAELAQQSRQQALWLRGGTAGLLGLVLLGSLALLRQRRAAPRPGAAGVDAGAQATTAADADGPAQATPAHGADRQRAVDVPAAGAWPADMLDDILMRSRLLALNASVQAARQGEPGPNEGAERQQLADAAERLVRQVDAARQGLRRQGRAAAAAAPSAAPALRRTAADGPDSEGPASQAPGDGPGTVDPPGAR